MRSLISIDFPAPEMEPEKRTCGISCLRSLAPMRRLHAATPRQHSPIRRYSALLRYSVVCFNSITQCN